jgi:uncharacterized membrane protein required for colicin V production
MIWDGFILYFAIAFAIAGWNVGFKRSLPSLLPVLAATVITQALYVDFATWIVEQLRIPPDSAVFIAYLLLWLVLEFAGEATLGMLFYSPTPRNMLKINRFGGSLIGIFKCATVLVFASLTALLNESVPDPPKYDSKAFWIMDSANSSTLLQMCESLAAVTPPKVAAAVVSMQKPTYTPEFHHSHDLHTSPRVREELVRLKQLMDDLRNLQ